MSDPDELQHRLKNDLGRFLRDVQTLRVVDAATFLKVDGGAAELARAFKGQSHVPKSILNELRTATKLLRAEAPYIEGESSRLVEMADKLEMTFDLILKGESPEDRVPGVPRIV